MHSDNLREASAAARRDRGGMASSLHMGGEGVLYMGRNNY